jgi:outer membrane protein OmpA-like peptidoglycan-associated protein
MDTSMPFLKTFILLSGAVLFANAMAQTFTLDAAASSELIDVASFFNGGYPYTPAQKKQENTDHIFNQLRGISYDRTVNPFVRDDLSRKGEEGNQEATLYYSLAAPATIEAFRVSGDDKRSDLTPRRVEFSVSQSPDGNFQTVATFDVPESTFAAPRTQYDFSIPVKQKVSGRYVRIVLSGTKYGHYRLSRFSAYGRFDQPVELRKDFSGVYHPYGNRNDDSLANREMVSQQKGTAHDPYLILHQKDGQITGCYVHGTNNGKSGSDGRLEEVSAVLGDLSGGVENNVFRFTRTHASDGSQSQGAMVFAPIVKGIFKDHYTYAGYFLVMKDAKPGGKEGDGAFRVNLTRYLGTPPPCAVTGQKEKTATEAMQESLEKTGKVQLYGVNFDFDSDALRPESGAVLDEVVKLAKANPSWKFEVGGHTDSIGSADYNLKLSDRRAASVARYLVGKGVDAARLKSKGYGATRPLIAGTDNAAHAQNRRVELLKQ